MAKTYHVAISIVATDTETGDEADAQPVGLSEHTGPISTYAGAEHVAEAALEAARGAFDWVIV